ncbi:Rha family transcriptional regulator [Salmonella enterica]|nr:Rha family transcriptional regulator [Salmonella enterica]
MATQLPFLRPNISIHDGRVITTSIDVANYFRKTHDNVLKKIRSVIAECDRTYHLVNFNEVVRNVPGGDGAVRKMPIFELTRDAFVLIIMGFTGKRALQWKINYINAFNKMEEKLHQQTILPEQNPMTIEGDGRSVLIRFDECGQIKSAEQIPEGSWVATTERITWYLKQKGYLVLPKDELTKVFSETLTRMALDN